MMDELESLRNTLNLAIDTLQDEIKRNGLPNFSNYSLDPHPLDRADFICPPRLHEARKLALAAMGQLRNMIQFPYDRVVEQSTAVLQTSGLDILIKTGVIDKLSEAPNPAVGMSVKALQDELDLDSGKLTTVLRYMAAQGWLRETSEGVFALTRLALELRNGALGRQWAIGTARPFAIAKATFDQITHSDREYRYSRSPDKTAFQIAYETDKHVFAYMTEHPDELEQFTRCIQSMGDAYQTPLETDFSWNRFEGHTIVDVGGGMGNLSLMLLKRLSNANFVVQDREEVVKLAEANIKHQVTDRTKFDRIKAMAHDFFEPQPIIGPDHVYMFRYILHDWPADIYMKILKNIVDVAESSAKILIIESVLIPCSTAIEPKPNGLQLDDLKDSERYKPISPPPFIPQNFGSFANVSLSLGYNMMGLLNALERTEREWRILLEHAGLTIDAIHPIRGMVSVIECSVRTEARREDRKHNIAPNSLIE